MTALDVLRRLDDLGVALTVADDRIRYRGRGDALPPELLAEMKQHRDELVDLLGRRQRLAWPPESTEDTGPLTAAQRSLWATTYFAEDGTYNLCGALRLRGALDTDAFTSALRDIHERHPSLRTVFPETAGEPRQRILPSVEPPLAVVDVDGMAECLAECARLADQPLALDTAPPVVMRLFRLAGGDNAADHVFFFVLHHVIADGSSFGPLLDDLANCYGARVAGEEPPPRTSTVDMVGYARWEADRLAYADLAPIRRYWRERLDDASLGALPLPPPLTPDDEARAEAHRVVVPAGTAAAVRGLAEATRSSVFTVVATAVAVALSRYTGRDDLVVGMPTSRRDRTGLERVVGLLLDMAPVRLDVSGASFADLVRRTRAAVLGAVRNTPVPADVAGARASFNVILTDLGADLPAPTFPGLAVEQVEVPQVGAKYDLNFLVRDGGDTLTVDVEADRRAVAGADVDAIAATALAVLTAAAADPTVPVAGLAVGPFGVAAPGATAEPVRVPRADESLTGRLAAMARTRGDAVAVTAPDGVLSYVDLQARVERVAAGLRARGVEAGHVVAISLPRGLDLVVAILGVMASGAACLVLHESWPRARVTDVLTDSRARLTITSGDTEVMGECATLAELAEVTAPLAHVPAHAAAYVIYTSGSTGRPKGVRVTHRNVLSLLDATVDGYGLGPDDVWTLFHACSFDVSMYEMFGCLLHGGRLVVVPRLTTWEPEEFAELCARERVTVLSQTPSALTVMLPALAARPESTEHMRYVLFAGEALDRRLVDRWYEAFGDRTQLVNMYGITETTVHASWRFLRPGDTWAAESDIGTPLPGTALHVLHDDGTPVADRCVGEIYVGGPQVSDGYLGRPRETALRFLPDPFSGVPGARLYRSGDLARRNGTTLAYLGRRDRQVQVNGFRVELAEIESALSARPGVAAAGAAVTTDGSGAYLVAVVVPAAGATPVPAELLAAVRTTLPGYMVPRTVVVVDELPLTTNGKLDRTAVVAVAAGTTATSTGGSAVPTGVRETVLLDVFREVLADPAVTTGTDFFDGGGDSMRAIRLVSLAKDRGLGLTVQDVYAAPTVAALAERVTETGETTGREPFSLLPKGSTFGPEVVDAYPMTALQSGMIYHQELAPGARVYHIMLSYRVRGVLDAAAFRAAAQAVTDTHPVLRTSFDLANELGPVQRVHAGITAPVEFEDLTRLGADEQEERIRQVVARETATDFDLATPPLFRLVVLITSDEDYQLIFTHHHAILDGWSVNVFFSDLHAQYQALLAEGTATPLPRPRTTFADYVALERAATTDADDRRFWAERTATRARLIAPDRSATPVMRRRDVDFAGALAGLRATATRLGVPVKALLCAAHLRVVSWLVGTDDVATSMVFGCRPEAQDSDRVLGLFLNQLPLRVRLAGQTWAELATHAHQEEQEMMRHRWYPNAAIQSAHGAVPMFDSSFNFTNYHNTRQLVSDGSLEFLDPDELESTHYAYSSAFTIDVRNHELRLLMEYDSSVLPETALALAAEVHRRAIAAIVADAERPFRDTPMPGIADLARLMAPGQPPAPVTTVAVTAPSAPSAPSVAALEASVREVWTEVLGSADIDSDTTFFDAGGNSIVAMQVVSRLRARHGGLSMRAFMAAPTIAGLANTLADAAAPAPAAVVPAAPEPTVARYPLSRAQRQMWEIASHLPGVGLFIVAGALSADGPLDVAVLERTFAELVVRHEALRTRFEDTDDGPVQVVEPHVTVTVEVEDHTAEKDPVRRCEKLMAAAAREALPLDRAPLMRVVVHRLAEERHVIFLSMHHIVCDGRSHTVLLHDAARIYREIAADGAPAPRPVPRGSGRLAKDRADWLTTEEAARQREFWLDRLTPPFPKLADGPGSRFAEVGTASFVQRMRSAVTRVTFSSDDMRTVSAAARRHGMTDFMLVLGAYAATLRAWSGLDDIRVATMLANRVEPGMDEVVGLITNTVVLRLRPGDGDPVAVSRQAREVCVDAFDNQELPFEEVLAELDDRYPDAGAVFEAMLVGQEDIPTVTPDDGLVFSSYASDRDVVGTQVVATASGFVLGIAPLDGGGLLFELRYKPATTSKELATDLLAAITTAVRTTAAALLEAGS